MHYYLLDEVSNNADCIYVSSIVLILWSIKDK